MLVGKSKDPPGKQAASASVMEAAGSSDSGEAGVTVTVTSCGRLELLDATLASLWKV